MVKKSTEQQFPTAMLTLAYWYEEGKAVTKDPQKAQKIYLELAEKNHPQALYLLGYQSATGMYDKVNYPQAFQYFTRAAEQGFSPAQNSLGMLYLTGQGTEKDPQAAIKWLTLAVPSKVRLPHNLILRLSMLAVMALKLTRLKPVTGLSKRRSKIVLMPNMQQGHATSMGWGLKPMIKKRYVGISLPPLKVMNELQKKY